MLQRCRSYVQECGPQLRCYTAVAANPVLRIDILRGKEVHSSTHIRIVKTSHKLFIIEEFLLDKFIVNFNKIVIILGFDRKLFGLSVPRQLVINCVIV